MKALVLALSLVSFNSFASEAIFEISEYRASGKHSIVAAYEVNEELGRAWAEISVSQSFTDSGPDYYRAQVPGLSLKGDNVVLNVNGTETVCAVMKKVGIFGYRVPRATKNCKFTVTSRTDVRDDGYEQHKTNFFVVSHGVK